MRKKELLARIELLEARVQQLEAQPLVYPYWSVIPPVEPWFPTVWSNGTSDPLPHPSTSV